MNSEPSRPSHDRPVYDEEIDIHYSIAVIAELAGVNSTTVIRYQEQGFIRPAARDAEGNAVFDVDGLRQLRRIAHLRETCEMNDAGLKLMLDLLEEIERLREERRQMLR